MTQKSDFLANIRKILKLHESMLKTICEEYNLTLIEATVISFLKNHPDRDTAADIAELRMLSKGNISAAVEGLIQKKLIKRHQDTADRRRIHLTLLSDSRPITESMNLLQDNFIDDILDGFSDEERVTLTELLNRIMANTHTAIERRKNA